MPNEIKKAYLVSLAIEDNSDIKILAENFYKTAKDKGRNVARDLLEEVFNKREEANNNLNTFLEKY